MVTTKLTGFIVILLAFTFSVASLLLPVPEGNTWLEFHSYFGLALATTIQYFGASVLFIMGLDGFTAQLRRSYIFMCIGIVMLGVAQMQLPLMIALGELNSLWYRTGIIALPYLGALLMLSLGVRRFTRLFGIKNVTTSFWFGVGLTILCSLLFSLIAKPPLGISAKEFYGANVLNIFNITFTVLIALQIYQVRRTASAAYTSAVTWLLSGFTLTALSGIAYQVSIVLIGGQQWYITAATVLVPSAITGSLLVVSAYKFNLITLFDQEADRSLAATLASKTVRASRKPNLSSIDVVIYTAGLASNPRRIDSILDSVRVVTARLSPGQGLSDSDDVKMMEAYLSLERYLIEQEPVRKFTRDSLRAYVAKALALEQVPQRTFWGRLF